MEMNREQEIKFRKLIAEKVKNDNGELWDECDHKTFFSSLFEAMDFCVAEYIDYEGSYQGDYLIFVRDSDVDYDGFYLCRFGYGSCSGCDSIFAAHTINDLVKIAKDLLFSLKKFNYSEFNVLLGLLGV